MRSAENSAHLPGLAAVAVTVFVAHLAWAFASPVGSVPDEPAHLVYAWGLSTGQGPGNGDTACIEDGNCYLQRYDVPAGLIPDVSCHQFKPAVPAGCETPVGDNALTNMIRYPPAFYLTIGLSARAASAVGAAPNVLFELGRVISALLSTSLVVSALAVARNRIVTVSAIVAILTPMTMFLSSSVNPNGAEALGAVAAASAGRALLDRPNSWSLVATFGYGMFWLTWSRPIGWLWGGILLAAIALHASYPSGSSLPRGKATIEGLMRVRRTLVVGSLLTTLSAAWFIYAIQIRATAYDDGETMPPTTGGRILALLLRWGGMIDEVLGILGWVDTAVPKLVGFGTFGALFGVLLLALHRAERREWTVFLLNSAAIFTVVTYLMHRQSFLWQGRYALPPVAAAIVLASWGNHDRSTKTSAVRLAQLGWLCSVAGGAWLYARYSWGLVAGPRYRLPIFENPVRWESLLTSELLLALLAASAIAGVLLLEWRLRSDSAKPTGNFAVDAHTEHPD